MRVSTLAASLVLLDESESAQLLLLKAFIQRQTHSYYTSVHGRIHGDMANPLKGLSLILSLLQNVTLNI